MNNPPIHPIEEAPLPDVDAMIAGLTTSLRAFLEQRGITDPVMVGIHTGGAWVAQRLHQDLGLAAPLGELDISFYRDDFSRAGLNPQVKPSHMPAAVDDRHVILVDDVLHTGRTIRAAMNEIFDYGRPASIILVALVERRGHELPIRADLVAARVDLTPDQHVTLSGPAPLTLTVGSRRKARVGDIGAEDPE